MKGKTGLKLERAEVWEDSGEGRRSGKSECTKQMARKSNRFGIWGLHLAAARVIHFRNLKALSKDNISVGDASTLNRLG